MNESLDFLKVLIKQVDETFRLRFLESQILETLADIENDTSLLAPIKTRAATGANMAIRKLHERYEDPFALAEALRNAKGTIDILGREEIEEIASWFFHLAYTRHQITDEMIINFRPLIAVTQGDTDKNKSKLIMDFDRYRLFSEWDFELDLTESNLYGILVSLQVLALPESFVPDLSSKAIACLNQVQARREREIDIPTHKKIEGALTKYADVINPAYERLHDGNQLFLDQNESYVLHACLEKTKAYLENNDMQMRVELSNVTNLLRSKFYRVRYRSSTYLFKEIATQLNIVEEELLRSNNFSDIKDRIKHIHTEIGSCAYGQPGVNKMWKYHVVNARALANNIYASIERKELDFDQFSEQVRDVEAQVSEMHLIEPAPPPGAIIRVQDRVSKNSDLRNWAYKCTERASPQREEALARLNSILDECSSLWNKTIETEQERVQSFIEECESLIAQMQRTNQYSEIYQDIKNHERSIDQFLASSRPVLKECISSAKSQLHSLINNEAALLAYINSISRQIAEHHRQIYRYIDFDTLHVDAVAARRWANHFWLAVEKSKRLELNEQITNLFTEIKKLRWRQQKHLANIQDYSYDELQRMVREEVETALSSPGNPRNWEALNELKRQVDGSRNVQTVQRNELLEYLVEGLSKVRQLRAAFATNSAVVFANYNDELSNIMMILEMDSSRNAAFDAISQVKPIRTNLREETRLLKVHREDLYATLQAISDAIEETFERAEYASDQEFFHLKADLEELSNIVQSTMNIVTLEDAIQSHKELNKRVNEARLPFSRRRDLKMELERLWSDDDGIAERMRALKHGRYLGAQVDATLQSLVDEGYLSIASDVPII